MIDPLTIPTDYRPGHEKARLIAPEIADNYVAHTLIGDPITEAMTADLREFEREEATRLIQLGMDNPGGGIALQDAPASLRAFFQDAETPPEWLDNSAFTAGIRMFHRNSRLVLAAFVAGVLVEGFTTNIAKSFFITGRVRDQGVRRLKQNNRHMIDIVLPSGLDRDGDGWKLSVRIRIIHARIRRLLLHSGEWNGEAWGLPVSAAHLGYAIAAFSARLLKHMQTLGADYNDEEYASFMAVWRYSGHLMGIPNTILFREGADALELYDIGHMCEPLTEEESIGMAHSLINPAPLVAGVTTPEDRRKLTKYVFRLSRGLIGKTVADELQFPPVSSFAAVPWWRLQEVYGQVMSKLVPGRDQEYNLNRFTGLLETSVFDEAGISYRLPDHVYAEESSKW